jgi:branched-chain amino acid transport system substrate-binding protein
VLVSADDACGVEQAEAAARQLVDAGARLVVGHLCSHSSLVAAAVYEAAGVPMVTTTSSHPRLTEEGRGNVFRLIGRDDAQGRIAGDLLAERWRHGRIAILHDGSTYGAGLAAEARRRLRERGVAEVLHAAYPPGAEDYSALLGQLRQAAVEVAYVGGYGPDAARIVRAAREGGDDLRLVGGHALGMAEFWAVAGAAGEGTVFTGRRDAGPGPGGGPGAARACAPRAPGGARPASPPTPRSRCGRRRRSGPAARTAGGDQGPCAAAGSRPSSAESRSTPRATWRVPPGSGRCGGTGTTGR